MQDRDMKQCGPWPIGVCSWSLQRTDVAALAQALAEVGLSHVNLAVGQASQARDAGFVEAVQARGWTLSATMIAFPQEDYSTLDSIRRTGGIVPGECWDSNRSLFSEAVRITSELGVKVLSMHLGFIDHRDQAYGRMMRERTLRLADAAGERGIGLLLETGQETAADLRAFLESLDHPALGINFDPANMILYGQGDPVEAVALLSPWIRHVHVKDALPTAAQGTWGTEVRWGDGQVDSRAFLDSLQRIGFQGTLAIERESGDSRIEDIRLAVERLASYGD
jgi:L-ribulose-5-phosphate 3-epimerase